MSRASLNLPTLEALAAPIFWEPVTGSGERICIAIAVAPKFGPAKVVSTISPKLSKIMFQAQGANANAIISMVAKTVKRHINSGKRLSEWRPPFGGVQMNEPEIYEGFDTAHIIEQLRGLYSAFGGFGLEDEQEKDERVLIETGELREQVFRGLQAKMGIDASELINERGTVDVIRNGVRHFYDIPIYDGYRNVASILSANGATFYHLSHHFLEAQLAIQAVSQNKNIPRRAIFACRERGQRALGNTEAELEKLYERLDDAGIETIVHDSPPKLIDSIFEWQKEAV